MKNPTEHQRTILEAAAARDHISSWDCRLQDLNRLANMGLLEAFDCEPSWKTDRVIVKFYITDAGRSVLAQMSGPVRHITKYYHRL